MRARHVFSSLAITPVLTLALTASGVILAESLFVGTERAELLSEPDAVFGEVLRTLERGDEIEGDEAIWESARRGNSYVPVITRDGLSGFVQASALLDEKPTYGQATVRTSSGAEGAGAAARGLTSQIEADLSAGDPSFRQHIREVDQAERAVNVRLRESRGGSYADQRPGALREKVSTFMKEGGLKHER